MKHRERVLIGRTDDGDPIYKWVSGRNLDELHDAIVQTYVDCGLIGRFLVNGSIPPDKRLTFREYVENWMTTYKDPALKPTTLAAYRSMLRSHFYPVFGERVLCQITVEELQEFLNDRSELSRKYLTDMVKFFGMILRDAMEDGVVEKDITASRKLVIPSTKRTVREALNIADYMDIVRNLPLLSGRDRRLMAILLYTGLRRGEALGLMWQDIDAKHRTIHVQRNVTYHTPKPLVGTPKTENGYREVPLIPHLSEVLEPLQKEGFIICGKNIAEPLCLSTYVRSWKRIGQTIDLHGATPHVFRHTFLTILAGLGTDVKTLQAIAGHGDIQITMNRYVHKRVEGLTAAGEQFEKSVLCAGTVPDIDLPEVRILNDSKEDEDE